MMHCTLCNHVFCWVCGFAETSIVHGLQNGGHVCQWLNAFTFGYETDKGLFYRIIMTTLLILFVPVIVYLVLIIQLVVTMYERVGDRILCLDCRCQRHQKCCLKFFIFLALLPFRLAIFSLVLAISLTLSTIAIGLVIIPYYLVILTSVCYFVYRWCLKSKRQRTVK